jgi:glutamate/tyrosine decarboxylase-like PLP-dependent enzyme
MPELRSLSAPNKLHRYAERFGIIRAFPQRGRASDEILRELQEIAAEEYSPWRSGKYSGTMYCGDSGHYDLLNETFALFSHMNALQRDTCPSATRFESEIVEMTLDMLHGSAAGPAHSPCGLVTSGGTESILTAMLAYRESARERGITHPQIIKPETAHPAFDKAAHLLGLELLVAPVEASTQVDVDYVADHIGPRTAAIIGSAGNYPYGTIDPIGQLSDLARSHEVGLHVDACLGGFILPWGEELGYAVPPFDFRVPGVTSISADTHKYGYGLKGASVVVFRNRELRRRAFFMQTNWSGGTYASPGIAGSRSVGLLASTWASLVSLGREGFLQHAREIFATSFAMQLAVVSHPELRLMGKPTFCFSFTSNRFDIYLLNDFMTDRGWRLNGQQRPDAVHMCVTRPQTRGNVVESFALDLADAVVAAKNAPPGKARSGAVYAGGTGERDNMIRYLESSLDRPQFVPQDTSDDAGTRGGS